MGGLLYCTPSDYRVAFSPFHHSRIYLPRVLLRYPYGPQAVEAGGVGGEEGVDELDPLAGGGEVGEEVQLGEGPCQGRTTTFSPLVIFIVKKLCTMSQSL